MEYFFTTPNGTEIFLNESFVFAFLMGMIFTSVQNVICEFCVWMLEKARYWRHKRLNG